MIEALDLLLKDLMETNILLLEKLLSRFFQYLMRIGHGKEKINSRGKIEIPCSFIIPSIDEKIP
ncbi:hypothetical protein H5410_039822 [Solanum commersonii]|uniref:Uncharacterized protein n=1 Tax=Solanum commersonii TaxID=4109 RepID=A0A9J5XPM0_SOLCO|nr:hypothetical protein H5410_039822 [Solanum commersonii]